MESDVHYHGAKVGMSFLGTDALAQKVTSIMIESRIGVLG